METAPFAQLLSHPSAPFVAGLMAALGLMEPLAAGLHRYVFHGPLWFIHQSHHPDPAHPRRGRFEHNDVFGVVFASIATALFVSSPGFLHWMSGAAAGVTLYGLIYGIIHDGFIHERGPTSSWFGGVRTRLQRQPRGPLSRWLFRIRGAHLLHHQGRCRDVRVGRSPYGLLAPVTRSDRPS